VAAFLAPARPKGPALVAAWRSELQGTTGERCALLRQAGPNGSGA
jgi:hypothetical protein